MKKTIKASNILSTHKFKEVRQGQVHGKVKERIYVFTITNNQNISVYNFKKLNINTLSEQIVLIKMTTVEQVSRYKRNLKKSDMKKFDSLDSLIKYNQALVEEYMDKLK